MSGVSGQGKVGSQWSMGEWSMNEMNERCWIRVSFIALIAVRGTCHGPKGTVNTAIDE